MAGSASDYCNFGIERVARCKEVGCRDGPAAWAKPQGAVLLRCRRTALLCLARGGMRRQPRHRRKTTRAPQTSPHTRP
eukprot:7322859-Alexandrium_andersonii.AAC.1